MLKPLLANYAVKRDDDTKLEGHYDQALSLWVTPSGKPLIAESKQLIELRTKSQGGRESDDIEPHYSHELVTLTKISREQDDMAPSYLLELMTKTDTVRERDDQ